MLININPITDMLSSLKIPAIIFVLLGPFFSTSLQGQGVNVPVFLKRECDQGGTVNYLDEDGQPRVGSSDGCCNSGTQARYTISDPDEVVLDKNIPSLSGGSSGWHVPVELIFRPGKSGTVVITIEYRERYDKAPGPIFCNCDWRSWTPLLQYRITVGPVNPGGELVNNNYQPSFEKYIAASDEANKNLSLTYRPLEEWRETVDLVEYWVKTPVDSIYKGQFVPPASPSAFLALTHSATQYGDYIFGTNLKDTCDIWYPGPTRTISFVPSCYDDTSPAPLVTGPSLDTFPEGFRVTAGPSYNLSFPGVTKLLNFYTITQDGGNDILLNENPGDLIDFSISNDLGSYRIEPVKKDFVGEYCLTLDPVKIFAGGKDATYELTCSVTLPEDLTIDFGYRPEDDPDSLVLQHFAATIKSSKKVVVKPGLILESGAELILEYDQPGLNPNDPDKVFNFTQLTVYNDFGEVTGESRSYFDGRGRPTQVQAKNLAAGTVLASETLYDAYDRPAVQMLSAPLRASSFPVSSEEDECPQVTSANLRFSFQENFVEYDSKNFDLDKRLNPDPLASSVAGTLGWYYGPGNGQAANERLNEPLNAQTAYPYTRSLYRDDGSGDVEGMTRPGDAYAAGTGRVGLQQKRAVAADDPYLADYLGILDQELQLPVPVQKAGEFMAQEVTDEDGRKSVTYLDKDEKAIMSLYYGKQASPILKSYQFYNLKDQLVCSITPNGVRQYEGGVPYDSLDKTTYEYNWKGFMTAINETDAGRTEYRYARDGRIRFSQNAEQREPGAFSYTDYDQTNRPIESGEYDPAGGGVTFDSPQMLALLDQRGTEGQLTGTTKDYVTLTAYDQPVSLPQGYGHLIQRFVMGAVSSTWYTTNGFTVQTIYSYDERGRVEWLLQDLPGLGVKLLEYKYGPDGNMKEVAYQRDSTDQYYHYYEYDADTRLVGAYSGTVAPTYDAQLEITNLQQLALQATYSYYLHGPLKRMELPQVQQGMDYTYTVDGKLKSINWSEPNADPGNDGNDVFGMSLDYFADDYKSTSLNPSSVNFPQEEQYSGNIRAQQWYSPVDGRPGPGSPTKAYAYGYDDRQQLANADFGEINTQTNTVTPSSDYHVEIAGYDDNGNISALIRNGENGQVLHDLTYQYLPKTNRLDKVLQGDTVLLDYTYNAIGQLVKQEKGADAMHVTYDVSGKVTAVYADEAKTEAIVTFDYDDRGFRLSKTTYDSLHQPAWRTWYVRDGNGSVLSIYVQNLAAAGELTQYEVPVYGSSRLGMYRPLDQTNYYEIKDHLGNVRVVIGGSTSVSYLATMEVYRDSLESPYFEQNKVVTVADHLNHTPDSLANKAIRINNVLDQEPNAVGAGITLRVFPGDTLEAQVFAKYEDFDNSTNNVIPTLAGYLGTVFGTPGIGENPISPFDVVDDPSFLSLEAWDQFDDQQPRLYLNYLLYDNNFNLVDFGFDQVSEVAKVPGDTTLLVSHAFEKLFIKVTAQQAGFIYVYVSNENDQNVTAYFDDLGVEHTYGNIAVATDRYPFGLAMVGRELERVKWRYGYQGDFAEEDEETGWNSFEARMYDPVIGRWISTDPERQFASPYLAYANNPIIFVDPDGKEVIIGNLTQEQQAIIQTLRKQDVYFDVIYTALEKSTNVFEINAVDEGLGSFIPNPEGGGKINIGTFNSTTLREETFHGFQSDFYGYKQMVNNRTNIEFEAKFFDAVTGLLQEQAAPSPAGTNMNFTLFLIEFIESGAFKLGAEQLVKYIEFVEQFRAYYEEFNKLNNENINYADSPVNPSMGPDAALEVINKANND